VTLSSLPSETAILPLTRKGSVDCGDTSIFLRQIVSPGRSSGRIEGSRIQTSSRVVSILPIRVCRLSTVVGRDITEQLPL
jgi:hypothetical protein